MHTNAPTLHLCDFDGTLTRRDSLLQFLMFAVPPQQLVGSGFVLIWRFFVLILKGKWSNEAGKETLLACFFKHRTARDLEVLGERFCREKLPALLRGSLLDQLRAARQKGDTVAVVSASPDIWLRPFCRAEGFDLLCTELEFASGEAGGLPRFTGRLATPNCNGPEKARRILATYDRSRFSNIIAYGNSGGDAAMFELAGERVKF